jgi:membrane protease YdiL (CAAX protease family)
VAVVPVIEELFFRGLLLRSLVRICGPAGKALGPVLAVTLTGVLFGLAHAETLQLLGLAGFGIVLSAMAYKFDRLGPGIFAHGGFNLVAVLALAARSTGH